MDPLLISTEILTRIEAPPTELASLDGWSSPLPIQPAAIDPTLRQSPSGNGVPRGQGTGFGTGVGQGIGPGRGNGKPLAPIPVQVDLRDLGLRGSAVPVHTVRNGETFADTKVVVRVEFGADGTPYRWEPLYGDSRLIPDAISASRRYFFTVPPHLQVQAPLRVNLVFRFRELAGTAVSKSASPDGRRAPEYAAAAFRLLHGEEPVFHPRAGDAFSDPRVVLRVFLRENGVPFQVEAISGDPRLLSSAERAALNHRYLIPPEIRRLAPIAVILSLTFADLPQ